jgi:DNA-binding response OmpR family regulator
MRKQSDRMRGRRVLLVEDEYFVADDLKRSFEEAGAEILGPVPTIDQALQLFESTTGIDAAVLDVNLRGELVYPLVDRLLEARVAIVFVTGYDASEIPAAYQQIAVCEKPLAIDKVISALER